MIIPCYSGDEINIYRTDGRGFQIDAPRGSVEIPFLPWMDEFDCSDEDHGLGLIDLLSNIISSLVHESQTERADRDPRLKDVLEKADDWAALQTFHGKISLCIQGPSDYDDGTVWAQQKKLTIYAPDHILDQNTTSSRKCASIFFQNGSVRIGPQYRASIPRVGYADAIAYMHALNNPPPRRHYISDAPYSSTTQIVRPVHRPGDQMGSRRR